MNPAVEFSFNRIALLMKGAFFHRKTALMLFSGIIGVMVFAGAVISAAQKSPQPIHLCLFPTALLLAVLYFPCAAFAELGKENLGSSFFLVPATLFEKWISAFLFSSLGLAAGVLCFYLAVSLAAELFNQLVFGRSNSVLNMFDVFSLKVAGAYLVLHSVLFAGASWFRRFVFIKTFLFVLAASAGLCVFTLICARLLMGDWFNGPFDLGEIWRLLSPEWTRAVEDSICWVSSGLFWFVLPVFCWTISFFKFRETEE